MCDREQETGSENKTVRMLEMIPMISWYFSTSQNHTLYIPQNMHLILYYVPLWLYYQFLEVPCSIVFHLIIW